MFQEYYGMTENREILYKTDFEDKPIDEFYVQESVEEVNIH